MSSLEEAERCQRIEEIDVSRDRLSSLPTDLLIKILLLLSTKDAVCTMRLSKQWRFIWTMVPKLEFKDTSGDENQSSWKFLGKFLELHKSPVLESLCIHLAQRYDIIIEELVSNSVDRFVRKIELEFLWTTEPTRLPTSLYTCKTLVKLTLSNKILVDVPSSACLPCLKILHLIFVVFKDEDSVKNLVSGCSIVVRSRVYLCMGNRLENPRPFRHNFLNDDVPSIWIFSSIEDNSLRATSFATSFFIALGDPMVGHFNNITFPRLQNFTLFRFGHLWLNQLLKMLNNSPKLRILHVNWVQGTEYLPPLPWIQPNNVPRCLLFHLEEIIWKGYKGTELENQVMRYILANSKRLKKVKITVISSTSDLEEKEMIIKDITSMARVSTCELQFP